MLALGVYTFLPSPVAAQTPPAPWSATDVGAPSVQGRATFDNGEFSISGAGTDIWGTADQFMFVHQRLDGDGVIVARVSSPAPTDAWAKAGVMIRESLDADSKHAFLLTSAGSGRAFHRRRVTGGPSVHTSGGAGTAPVWVMLERSASTIRAFLSADGATWTLIGTDVIAMSETVYVGLAVTSRNEDMATAAALNNVSVTPLQAVTAASLPIGWTSTDIGLPLIAGSSDYSAGTFTVTGAGADIWGSSDQFHYAYRQVTGDIEIIARVTAVENVDPGSKAGVMIRDALTPNAAHASMFVGAGNVVSLQERALPGGPTVQTSGTAASAPYWVRLERRAGIVSAFRSSDGATWTLTGVATMLLPNMYVGLAVTSHNTMVAATAIFDNVIVRPPLPPTNLLPSISLISPPDNALFEDEVATIPLSVDAADADGTVDRVDFYANGILLGSDTTSPFSYTWDDPADGIYILSATATDNEGATTTSEPRTIERYRNRRPTTSLTTPADGATFTAPATVTMAATASDPDGTIARVEFHRNGTLVGTDTTSPYSLTWSNVPAGTYSLTSVAVDNLGKAGTSAARTITVNGPANQPPTAALSTPANGATFTAPATVAMTATATDTDGTIAKVDFYRDGTLIGSDTTNSYSYTWNNVAAGTYSLTAVATDNSGATTTSAARSITVTGTSLPAGWTGADIGQPAVAGSARHTTGTFTVDGAGTDIWDTSDQFQYVYRQFTGDIEIISRVVSLENTDEFAKAGVMIRGALTANAAHISLVVTPGHGTNLYERPTAGAVTSGTPTAPTGAPSWVRLERLGTVVTAFQSSDGVTWTSVGTMTMAASTMYVGLAVTSHAAATAATGVFDNVVVRTPAPGNQAPTAALTAPANGATFTAPATVAMTATASDTDGTIASVSFFAGTTLVGSDTTSPYSVTWNNVPAGTYSLTAVAQDNDGDTRTSAARTITVTNPSSSPSRAVFVASSNHNTAVTRYVLEIFTSGANPNTATPVATRDMGKPPVVSGECDVDVTTTINSLPPGQYIATVTAVGSGGSTRSAPSAAFNR